MLLGFVILYLLLTIGIGWWASRRVKNTTDFVIAGRKLPMIVAASALFATWFGSETIMGAFSEFVEKGLIGVIEDPFGAALCLILVGAFFARPLYRLQILTFNDFFKRRFGDRSEWLSAVFIVPSYFGWIAAQLVAMAIVLQTITGLSMEWGVLICAFVVVFYTYIGGMWAVSITDFLQTIMIVIGLFILLAQLLVEVGGIQRVVAETPKGFFNFFPEHSLDAWVHYLAAWITIGLGSIPQQDVFQRVLAAKDERTAVRASYLSGVMYLTLGFVPLLIGLCGKILYPEMQDGDPQLLLPNMVLAHSLLPIQIIFFGALLSAILSTTSGAMLAPATVIGENLVRPYFTEVDDQKLLQIMRWSVFGVAVCSVLMALWKSNIYDLVAQSSALSLVSLFVPLTAGLYWKRASAAGSLAAMLVGMSVWIYCEYVVPSAWPALVWGGLASWAAMWLVSWLSPDDTYTAYAKWKACSSAFRQMDRHG